MFHIIHSSYFVYAVLVQHVRNTYPNYLSEFPSAALSSIAIATAMTHSSALQLKIHPAYFWSSYFVYAVLDKMRNIFLSFNRANIRFYYITHLRSSQLICVFFVQLRKYNLIDSTFMSILMNF